MRARFLLRVTLAALLPLLLACAKQVPPPGGPVDRTAPTLLESEPTSGSVRVALTAPVVLTFSEPMQREEVERALNIFPAPEYPPDLKWRGNRLVMSPDTAWRTNQTYVVTLQAEARDRRNNRLSQSLQLAFATGDRIDSAIIEGRILRGEQAAQGALALCYAAGPAGNDPEYDTALYVVQADSAGMFRFQFLAPGHYRVFGLDDRDRDWLWNVGTEQIAVPARDIEIRSGSDTLVLPPLKLQILDTARVSLIDCRMPAPQFLSLQLEGLLDSAELNNLEVRVVHAERQVTSKRLFGLDSLVQEIYAELNEDLEPGAWEVVMKIPRPGGKSATEDTCLLEVEAVPTPATLTQVRRLTPDTTGPLPEHASHLVLQMPQPIKTLLADSIEAVAAETSTWVPCSLLTPFQAVVHLPAQSTPGGPVTLTLPAGIIQTDGGEWPADSARAITLDQPFLDSTGIFEVYPDLPVGTADERYLLGLTVVAAMHPPVWRLVRSGEVVFGRLQKGDYRLTLFGDRDRDLHWDAGWPFPFEPSEPVWLYPDTLQVRARFTTELRLPAPAKK